MGRISNDPCNCMTTRLKWSSDCKWSWFNGRGNQMIMINNDHGNWMTTRLKWSLECQ